MDSWNNAQFTGLILSGGQSRRMGGEDKGWIRFNGKPMIEHAVTALRPICDHVIVSANRHIGDYLNLDVAVKPDVIGESLGPLVGIYSALREVETPFAVVIPVDAPLLEPELFLRLYSSLVETNSDVAIPMENNKPHAVTLILRPYIVESIFTFLDSGERKVQDWLFAQNHVKVDCDDIAFQFRNLNTPDDIKNASHG